MDEYTIEESNFLINEMSKEDKIITNWPEKAREAELAWIKENLVVFCDFAAEQYEENGRGAVYIDTSQYDEERGGKHPLK